MIDVIYANTTNHPKDTKPHFDIEKLKAEKELKLDIVRILYAERRKLDEKIQQRKKQIEEIELRIDTEVES